MFDSEVTLMILSPNEKLLGTLHPRYVDVEESNDKAGLRTIKITHPLYDDQKKNLNYYNNLLKHGNKVFWSETPDGNSCLYVLLDDKTLDKSKNTVVMTAEEVASEISMLPPIRFGLTTRSIDTNAINTWFGILFTAGTIETTTLNYTGKINLKDLLNLIATQGNKEIQYRYEYIPNDDIILRYVDIVTTKGKTHNTPIEAGYNTDNILLEETEATVAIAASPTGTPSDSATDGITTFNNAHAAFEALAITEGQMIPSIVTKDSNGNDINGPLAAAPYAKIADTNYVQCPIEDSKANYKTIQSKEKGNITIPRTISFNSSEENKYNLYWACVSQINSNKEPGITLTAQVIDISKLKGDDPEYYNAGDTVYVDIPGFKNRVPARIIKTTKNPRTPDKDKLEIGNYVFDFIGDFVNNFS